MIMKKIAAATLSILFLFAPIFGEAAETEQEDTLTKEQIRYQGEVLTYNELLPKTFWKFEVSSSFEDLPDEDYPLKIQTNKDGVVRCITIRSDEVETYDGIVAGLSENRITAMYDKVIEAGSDVYLYYQEDTMLGKEELPPKENALIYTYRITDGRIGLITICDSIYASKMK